jgi:hypothetical protein
MEQIVDSRFGLPYRVHTNFELGLMLAGKKPLAVFTDWQEHVHPVLARYMRMFDRHVAAGTFVKHTHVTPPDPETGHPGNWMALYAHPDEAWRFDALIDLRNVALQRKWTADDERRFGHLLGYEDWQNDAWLERNPIGA